MYKDIYMYPAIIAKLGDNDYNVRFPDFEIINTYGENLENAYIMSEDALSLELFDLYEDKKEIPDGIEIDDIELKSNETLILVKVNLRDIVRKYDNKAVKKTLSIPSWLDKLAKAEKINFSQVLQEALESKLNRKMH